MSRPRMRRLAYGIGAIALLVVIIVAVWSWDWFVPIGQRLASSYLGRRITIAHLHVQIARNPILEARGIRISNPEGLPQDRDFAVIDRLTVEIDGPAYLRQRILLLPGIELGHPVIEAQALPDGR